jgi:carboxymethylenebutenolidase
MKLHTEWVEYEVDGKKVQGYFARPAAVQAPLPGVLVIQEAFGVDPHIQDVTERFATAGYAAFAPDLFSYGGKPATLAPDRIEDAKQFLDTIPQAAWFDAALRAPLIAALPGGRGKPIEETLGVLLVPNRPWDQYVATLRAARSWLVAGPSKGQKVGSVGWCMGGAISLRLACSEPELGAAVVFYGFTPPLEMLAALKCPVLGLYAENDPRINAGLPALAEAMKAQGKRFEHLIYPGTSHAFYNDTRGNYRVDAARDAWARTLSFFAANLGNA